jgi:hypothetical protein
MLFSEKNRMKTHTNQWLRTMPYPPERLTGATRRGHPMTPEGQKPSQWLCLTKLPRERCSQPIASKALSWGIIRKSACILAELTIRKSQECSTKGGWGSCSISQNAYTTSAGDQIWILTEADRRATRQFFCWRIGMGCGRLKLGCCSVPMWTGICCIILCRRMGS